jgi:hypothetical protein
MILAKFRRRVGGREENALCEDCRQKSRRQALLVRSLLWVARIALIYCVLTALRLLEKESSAYATVVIFAILVAICIEAFHFLAIRFLRVSREFNAYAARAHFSIEEHQRRFDKEKEELKQIREEKENELKGLGFIQGIAHRDELQAYYENPRNRLRLVRDENLNDGTA